MITKTEIKEKIQSVIDQFNTNENGYILCNQLLQKYTFVVSDTLCFYIDENLQLQVLFLQTSDGNEFTCEPSIEHKSITDYDCITKIDNIYINKLDNVKQQYFIDDNSLLRNDNGNIILIICKANDIQQFFYKHTDISKFEFNAFYWFDSNINELDLSKLNKLTSIPDYCFECKGFYQQLKTILLPENIKFIGESAFSHCEKLTNVNSINNFLTLNRISYAAFSYCPSLIEINLSNSILSTINAGAFNGCSSLLNISFPNTLSSLDAVFWEQTYISAENISLSNINIENTSIQILNQYQFAKCKSLQSLILPSTIRIFEDNVILSCDNLSLISFENANDIVSIHINDNDIINKIINDELSIIVKQDKFNVLTLNNDKKFDKKIHII